MKISAITSYSQPNRVNNSFQAKKVEKPELTKGMNGEELVMKGEANKYFKVVQNVSNSKVGSKFILESKLPQYKGLKMLITPESKLESNKMYIGVQSQKNPSFSGKIYGSIRNDGGKIDTAMADEYKKFWSTGMQEVSSTKYLDKKYAPLLKEDYNFYTPTDGDGTRYKDITTLQGGKTKPASYLPATLAYAPMSLIQGIMSNFARTGKLDDKYELIDVKPAQGSAFAFLEGLRTGKISTEKPIVFSWGDNFSDINISKLMYDYENSDSGFSITVLPVDKSRVKALGVIKAESLDSKRILEFVEKPQDDDYIESIVVDELGKDKCLASVGPYVVSPEALSWIKENYSANPKSFLNPDKGYDFSSMVIAPMLEAFNNGEIKSKDGKTLAMTFYIKPDKESWSDLGAQKDLCAEMKNLRKGKFAYLPEEVISSIKSNTDDKGNLAFNHKAKTMFDDMTSRLNLNAENVITYCE